MPRQHPNAAVVQECRVSLRIRTLKRRERRAPARSVGKVPASGGVSPASLFEHENGVCETPSLAGARRAKPSRRILRHWSTDQRQAHLKTGFAFFRFNFDFTAVAIGND